MKLYCEYKVRQQVNISLSHSIRYQTHTVHSCTELIDELSQRIKPNKTTNKSPFLSIIISILQPEAYFKYCIESVQNQSFTNFELIIVESCCSAITVQTLNEYAVHDTRISVLHLFQDFGGYCQRKIATNLAQGSYCLYMNADSHLTSSTSLEEIASSLSTSVDVVQFPAVPETSHSNKPNTFGSFLKSFRRTIRGKESILRTCFQSAALSGTIWNKIYNTYVCKRAYDTFTDLPTYTDEIVILWITLYYSRTVRIGHPSPVVPTLSYTDNDTLNAFRKTVCGETNAIDYINTFLEKKNDRKYTSLLISLAESFFERHMSLFHSMTNEHSAQAFDILTKVYPPFKVIDRLYQMYCNKESTLHEKIAGAQSLVPIPRQIKTVGVFYHRYFQGGIERVLSLQIPMFLELGYRVVFFTEQIEKSKEYELNQTVVRVKLPKELSDGRSRILGKKLHEYGVDLFLHHSGSSNILLYDLLTIKAQNIPVIVVRNELTFQFLEFSDPAILTYHKRYQIADLLIVLSRSEESYYKIMGVNVIYIPNPVRPNRIVHNYSQNEGYILWVGRLHESCKHYLDAVDIMAQVVKIVVDAKMVMLGGEFDKDSSLILKRHIKKNHLENNILWLGDVSDIDTWYRKAKIHLVTSSSESWGMAIFESKTYGIPLVLYSLPYLELLRSGGGFLEVEQGDTTTAAKMIVQLLRDDTVCMNMSIAAQESSLKFQNFDHKAVWRMIISNIENGNLSNIHKQSITKDDLELLFSSFLEQYRRRLVMKDNTSPWLYLSSIFRRIFPFSH